MKPETLRPTKADIAPLTNSEKKEQVNQNELVSETTTGAQATLLLGRWQNPRELQTDLQNKKAEIQIELINAATNGLNTDVSQKLHDASLNESLKKWRKDDYETAMTKWKARTDQYIKKEMENPTSKQFLQNLLKADGQEPDDVEVNATAIYNEFIMDRDKRIEYYAKKINKIATPDVIQQNKNLIKELAGIYGSASSENATQLTFGIANVRANAEGFINSVEKNFKRNRFGKTANWNAIEENCEELLARNKDKKIQKEEH
jgi:hypothetical protein